MKLEAYIDSVELRKNVLKISGWAIGTDMTHLIYKILEDNTDKEYRITHFVRTDVVAARDLPEEQYQCGYEIQCEIKRNRKYCLCIMDGNDTCNIPIDVNAVQIENKRNVRQYIIQQLKRKHIISDIKFIIRNGYKKYVDGVLEKMHVCDISYNHIREQWKKEEKLVAKQQNVIVSIVVPLFQTPRQFLEDMLKSVREQTYKNWELCLADASKNKDLYRYIRKYLKDSRIKYQYLGENKGIASNTNCAIKMATGDLIAFMDHDDYLDKEAVACLVEAFKQGADVIYTDEDKVTETLHTYYQPFFKPDYNKEYLRSVNYICHLFAVKRAVIGKVGMLDETYDGSQDYDFILRCCEVAEKIGHIPRVLYHWRVHERSVAGNAHSKLYAYQAGKKALEASMQRCGEIGVVEHGTNLGLYNCKYQCMGNPKITIVVDENISEETLASAALRTQYTNYEIVQKKAIKENNSNIGDYIVYLQNVDIVTDGWLEQLLANCQRENIGIIGTKVYNGQGNLTGGMLVCTGNGALSLAFSGMNKNLVTEFGRSVVQQNCSAVTGECVMIDRCLLESKGIQVVNDIHKIQDIWSKCFEAREKGIDVIWNPNIEAQQCGNQVSYEVDEEFERKWKKRLYTVDEYYNPNCNRDKADYTIMKEYILS